MPWHKINIDRHRVKVLVMALIFCVGQFYSSGLNPEVFDIEAARDLCDSTPLRSPEGIWVYPDDGVTVLIMRQPSVSNSLLPTFDIRVIESSDIRLRPGDIIGNLSSTPEKNKYEITLFTERRNNLLLKPQTVLALLSDEEETMVLKKRKPKFSLRFTFNPTTLLPQMWRIIRLNTSSAGNTNVEGAIGMVKIYPSYDGNGSSRRQPRYL